jgi:hypothetical protein
MRSINFFLFCLNTGDNAGSYRNGGSVLVPSGSFIQLEAAYSRGDWPTPYQFDSDMPLPVRARAAVKRR